MIQIENQSNNLADALNRAWEMTTHGRDEFITPEHLLWAIGWQRQFILASGGTMTTRMMIEHLQKYSAIVPEDVDYEGAEPSVQFIEMVNYAHAQVLSSGTKVIDVPHILQGMLQLEKSAAREALLAVCEGNMGEFMSKIIEEYSNKELEYTPEEQERTAEFEQYLQNAMEDAGENGWKKYVTCISDILHSHNPLIGRETELERTIQILCRLDKNNPLHVGEAGVGKTALAYGLAAKIESGEVPPRLLQCKVYELDLGALMAGTQYRGDLEKRLKQVLEGLTSLNQTVDDEFRYGAILYVDEIHNLVGAGRIEGGSLDISNLLKPYLERGELLVMGATTYEEYNHNFLRSKGFARRFEKIDITEPSVEQCKLILMGLKDRYEAYHHVTYTDEAIDYAVTASSKYITGRYLPDKAIDLIDEAGAWRELHEDEASDVQCVDKKLVAEVLTRICNVDTLAEDKDDIAQLQHLEQHIKSQIYGQDEAVKEVTEAVLMASAGLLDDNKPMASLLFVGPTGVGKTEVAKVLAKELNVPLLRFDMSEYAEKHTVAKLIGSPAGYVGYDDGGLLTDAIRKTPHCVLLFDELEKAHQDIYNILLQVMDYAVLTDNKGQKADFRHVVFIMTTNAGAQFARQGSVGFANNASAGDVMMKSVKKTFKPEFLNRLTGITIFHDMTRSMAELILDKKLALLSEKLAHKKVTMTLTTEAREHLLQAGFSEEYGGREIDRVITTQLKPLLMKAILFGNLKDGGEATVSVANDKLILKL